MYNAFVKRAIDFVVALITCPFVFLISIPVAIAIKIDDGGPVLYAGKRVGKNFKEFRMYKFRTMKNHAADIRNSDGSTYNSPDDPRLTRIGKILRKTSIDELPQVLNVLLGHMSLVGPRPSPLGNRSTYPDEYMVKFTVLPGITGYAQALLRNSGDLQTRISYDIYYVNHMSLFLDAKIALITVVSVLRKTHIYRETA